MMSVFELLEEEVKKLANSKFFTPTKPQELGIPKILEGKNVVIISETGTGKTEAALLPILSKIISEKPKEISTLYITPLKALNRDLLSRILWWTENLGIEASVRHGDTSPYVRKQQVEFPPQILIITAESLQPILVGKKIRELLKNVKWVIIDEVHELINSKRGVQLAAGLERLRKIANLQTIMLSATVYDAKEVGNFFCYRRNFEIIKAGEMKEKKVRVICPNISLEDRKTSEELLIPLEAASRLRKVKELIESSKSTLVFTNTREFAEILAYRLKALFPGFKVEVHHSSLGRDIRIEIEKKFKEEKIKAIVCTSSLQLGIDIGSVDLILQYGSPRKVTQFVQRLGRSGHRIEKTSRGIIIPTDEDEVFESLVIADLALKGRLDAERSYKGGLDVLVHQIAGMVLEGYSTLNEIYKTLTNCYPLRNVSEKEFLKICEFLARIGIIKLKEDGKIGKGGKIFDFYFSRLSTIPTTFQYKIVDITSNKTIGILDEEFVISDIEVGTRIIVKGVVWKVVNIEDDKVFVELSKEREGAIPSWQGELIPVSFEVSQNVAKLRKVLWNMDFEERKRYLLESYPLNEKCAERIAKVIEKQKKSRRLWDEKTIWIEVGKDILVLNMPFGNKVNTTISKFLEAILTARLGQKIKTFEDSYRIYIFPLIKPELVEETLKNTEPNLLENYINLFLPSTKLFLWKFVQVAKRFGLFHERADISDRILRKIIEEFSGSPVFFETLNEIKNEKMDLENSVKILRMIKDGKIGIKISKGLSYLSLIGLEKRFKEYVLSERDEKEILEIVKNRLLERKLLVICMNCGKWWRTIRVKDIEDSLKCNVCKSKLLTFSKNLNPKWIDLVKKYLKRRKLSKKEKKAIERLKERAYLFMDSGKLFAIVFAGRGIGINAVKRILHKRFLDEREIIKEIMNEEKKYVLTRKFWKV
ncbi:MAG: DEAD/DEAH box helicase [Candidatus Aenigmarchaeota archaeon]|nr:DEAD/DEAH box helicase [Candidatus Aenigmarchaeota archaeon]